MSIRSRGGSAFQLISRFVDVQARLNTSLHQDFQAKFSPPVAALASGTLIGAQSEFPRSLKKQLVNVGLIHVVVASGYNLTLIISYVQSLTTRIMPKRVGTWVSLVGVWWYVVFTGGSPSIVRAGWMASLSLFALLCGRPHSKWRGLFASILVMLALDVTLLTNISFQLSVTATMGVFLANSKHFDDWIANDPSRKGKLATVINVFVENARTTFGANLLTLPVIIFWFRRISLVSILANTVLLFLIPLIMCFAFLFLVSYSIHPWLSLPFVFVVNALADTFLYGVSLFDKVPYASVSTPYFGLGKMIGCYFLIFAFYKGVSTVLNHRKNKYDE